MRRRKIASTALAAVLAAGILWAGGTPAASAAGPCGSGYTKIASYPVTIAGDASTTFIKKFGPRGTKIGSLDVYWSASAKKNCAVHTAVGSTRGVKLQRYVGIQVAGQTKWSQDKGVYASYAGPVYTVAQRPGQCINVEAHVFEKSASGGLRSAAGTGRYRVHCG